MACFHATPLLSYGDDHPSWPVVDSTSAEEALALLRDRVSVHVADRDLAKQILLAAGVPDERADQRLLFAETGRLD